MFCCGKDLLLVANQLCVLTNQLCIYFSNMTDSSVVKAIRGRGRCIEFKGIEGVLWRKLRIASETGFPLELAVCAVSHLLSPAVQPSKRNICTVRNEDYITIQDATTSPYQKPRLTGCDAANQPVQKWHASNSGI